MALKVESGAQAAGIKIALDHAWRKASRIAPQRWGERPVVAVVVNEISGNQEVAKRLAFLQALEACQEGESAGHPSSGHRALMVACSLPRPVMKSSRP
jgi:hypothetical protein